MGRSSTVTKRTFKPRKKEKDLIDLTVVDGEEKSEIDLTVGVKQKKSRVKLVGGKKRRKKQQKKVRWADKPDTEMMIRKVDRLLELKKGW